MNREWEQEQLQKYALRIYSYNFSGKHTYNNYFFGRSLICCTVYFSDLFFCRVSSNSHFYWLIFFAPSR
jgi:hypothetical protein